MAFKEPFDLYHWFVNVFAGSVEMFLAISFITIAVLSGIFRMPTLVTGVSFALFVIMLGIISGNLLILALIIAAIIIGWIFARWVK